MSETKEEINQNRKAFCEMCDGEGLISNPDYNEKYIDDFKWIECSDCNGTGFEQ